MSGALAMFGNSSFFRTAADSSESDRRQALRQICQATRIPFYRLDTNFVYIFRLSDPCSSDNITDIGSDEDILSPFMANYFNQFLDPVHAAGQLDISMYFANEALIDITANQMSGSYHSLSIRSAPGHTVLKPQKSIPAIIIISLLIGAEVVGLLALARYIYSMPTWTGTLDAFALVQMGAQLGERANGELKEVSGLVGVLEPEGEEEALMKPAEEGRTKVEEKRTVGLALGAPGIVTKRLNKQKQ